MQFIITPTINGKVTRLYVSFIKKNESLEYYEVEGKNRKIILSCNRPVIQAKGLKKFPITWKIEEGKIGNPRIMEKITEAIQESWLQQQ
ncbi:MAG: hypothetical protein JST75_18690 [Bacteroidetes bacterium]|nr:hypothetical protein [Bacteroidota bacterium]